MVRGDGTIPIHEWSGIRMSPGTYIVFYKKTKYIYIKRFVFPDLAA